MDLVYTVYKHQSGGHWNPGSAGPLQSRPDAALCTVSSQNVVAFTADLPCGPEGRKVGGGNGGRGVYCADLNNPWEYK